ncbi:MAG: hypothetical protein WCJ33_05600 [Pseudomonadota bacterium]
MKYLKKFLISILAIILLIEEWLWDYFTIASKYLSSFLNLEKFESWLKNASRYVALIAFIIPILLITPLNLVAINLLTKGKIISALIIEIFAKLLATFLIARIFALTRNQLMTFAWFEKIYGKIISWLSWAHNIVEKSGLYIFVKSAKITLKEIYSRYITHRPK